MSPPEENEDELKQAFAMLLLKTPSDPFKAALSLFPNNTNRALWIAQNWPADILVLKSQREIIDEDDGELSFLPTKADFLGLVWDKMNTEFIDNEDFAKLGKLYADSRGFIKKPETLIDMSNKTVNNKVMIVNQSTTDEQWEGKLIEQQERLTNEAKRH